MLMGIDLFKNLDFYTVNMVSGMEILKMTLLYFPSAFLIGTGPSFLFSVTYFLSMLHASNEMISVLNSGINYKRFLLPIIFTAVFVSIAYFAVNETVALKFDNIKQAKKHIIDSTSAQSNDNSNVAIKNEDNTLIIHALDYFDENRTLYNITLIEKDLNGKFIRRINSKNALWNESESDWILKDVYIYTPSEKREDTLIEHLDEYETDKFNLDPELFRNISGDISKMSLPLAKSYLNRIKKLNRSQYASLGTEYYKRLLSCFTPFVMIIIACSMNYRFKKNILFFSLLCSVCTAVVYYVIQMITLMLSDQGLIHPSLGMVIPFLSIILLTFLLSIILRD